MSSMPQMQSVIYDQFGKPLVDINIHAPRSWLLDDVGQCVFTLSSKDPKCTEKNLRFGNMLYIQSTGLPDWVGIIDPPRGRNYGSITVTAYTAEYLFKLRNTIRAFQTGSVSAGAIFTRLLQNANNSGGTQVSKGSVYTGGPVVNTTIQLSSVYSELKRVAAINGNNWEIAAQLSSNNNLTLQANYFQRLGSIRNDYMIRDDDVEMIDVTGIDEQGPFYNIVDGYGNAASLDSRVYATVQNFESINLYGPHRTGLRVEANTDAVVRSRATTYLNSNLIPPKIINISVINRNNLWAKINLGDTVTVQLTYGAFYNNTNNINMRARITGMAVDEMTGKMKLVVQEV